MNILCVARYFPSYFRNFSEHLAGQQNNMVTFLTERCHKDLIAPNIAYKLVRFSPPNYKGAERDKLMQIRRLQAFTKSLEFLRQQGLRPDVLLVDMVGECTYAVQDIFPEASLYLHLGEFSPSTVAGDLGTAFTPNVLRQAKGAFVRYSYQKDSYSTELQKKIHVIPEGVDTQLFIPNATTLHIESTAEQLPWEVLTMHIRCVEDALKNDNFFTVLERLFEMRPHCHLVIIGRRSNIGSQPAELKDAFVNSQQSRNFFKNMSNRVHLVRAETQAEYVTLLRTCCIHLCAFNMRSIPFGTLEAMSSGCLVVGHNKPPLNTMLNNGHNSILCNFAKTKATAEQLNHIIAHPDDYADIRAGARARICEQYDATENLRKQCAVCGVE